MIALVTVRNPFSRFAARSSKNNAVRGWNITMKHESQTTSSTLFFVLVVCILVIADRASELSTLLLTVVRLIQTFELSVQSDIPTFIRSLSGFLQTMAGQSEPIQTLTNQMLLRGQVGTQEFRSAPSWARLKCLMIVASTNVSVIVPTWNEGKYIGKCLSSLKQQSLKNSFEVIVVDGGSTDRTLDIAREHAHRVLLAPGKPVGAARNLGASMSKGDILAFIDADTIASKDWLKTSLESFDLNPVAVGVTGPTIPYEGSRLDEGMYEIARWAQRISLKLGFPHIAGFNCAYRKDAFWRAGGFDEDRELSEDVMLSLKIRNQGPLLFNDEMVAYTSLRRIKQCGYPYLTTYYAINAMLLLFGRNLGYPKIR